MKKSYQRICTLIAAAEFSDREVMDFAELLRVEGPRQFLDDVFQIRDRLGISHLRTEDSIPDHVIGRDLSQATEQKITRLLIDEAGLPKSTAIELLTKAISARYPSHPIPPESRKGFLQWVRRLLDITSESELLHIATRIRNDFVHERPSDWRLK